MDRAVIIMGVAGCGKSSLGAELASALGRPLIEGDAHHSAANRARMTQGVALTDADRDGWLSALAAQLREHPGCVLTCSALKRKYRDRLRAASPGLAFLFLEIPRDESLARVSARGASHFFSADLVDSQFATLESPVGEPLVLRLDAMAPLPQLRAEAVAWLADNPGTA